MMAAPAQPGEILAGKFRIDRVLGAGGMGTVVAATHLQLGHSVALKFMLDHALEKPDLIGRFLREARAAAQLRSQHVARILDVGALDGGAPYIVMELLEGTDLETLLARAGRLPPASAVDLVLQACDAIGEAHALGIVHRDVKPANLFVTSAPSGAPLVKVLDFGIAKASSTSSATVTQTAVIFGSPAYMSPEQMRSTRDVDARTDIWSLGIILYEAIAGGAPFRGETFTEVCLKVAMDPTPPLPRVPGLAPGLERVIARCLEKDPAARFTSIDELCAALAPFATGRAPARRRRAPMVIAALLLLLGGGAGAALAPRTGGRAPVTPAPVMTLPDAPPPDLPPPDAPPPDAPPPPDARPDAPASPRPPLPASRRRATPEPDPLGSPE
jgi:serine/threonine-protein kinase